MKTPPFSDAVLAWYDQYGRKNLPWQQDVTPYKVWVSEIMLQQTQVATVIPYFERFMASFPNVESLADADADDVLHHWTGLGYYARARNLHKTAKTIAQDFNGAFPKTVDELEQLSGIGRSTAGAIRSLGHQLPAAILDGNVKRVLCRAFTIEGWPGQTKTLKHLWQVAEELTPTKRNNHYTQAMMDLGATVCTRSKPACGTCPIAPQCQAYAHGTQANYPEKKPKKAIPTKTAHLLLISNQQGDIYLEKRPPAGIWGSLWSLPETNPQLNAGLAPDLCDIEAWTEKRHTFSHFHLEMKIYRAQFKPNTNAVFETDQTLWYKLHQPQNIGLAAPIKSLLAAAKNDVPEAL